MDEVSELGADPLAEEGEGLETVSTAEAGEPYACFSLLEAMQVGAVNMSSQARFERSSTR